MRDASATTSSSPRCQGWPTPRLDSPTAASGSGTRPCRVARRSPRSAAASSPRSPCSARSSADGGERARPGSSRSRPRGGRRPDGVRVGHLLLRRRRSRPPACPRGSRAQLLSAVPRRSRGPRRIRRRTLARARGDDGLAGMGRGARVRRRCHSCPPRRGASHPLARLGGDALGRGDPPRGPGTRSAVLLGARVVRDRAQRAGRRQRGHASGLRPDLPGRPGGRRRAAPRAGARGHTRLAATEHGPRGSRWRAPA